MQALVGCSRGTFAGDAFVVLMEAGSLEAADASMQVVGPQEVAITVVKCAHARLLAALEASPSQALDISASQLASSGYVMSVQLPEEVLAWGSGERDMPHAKRSLRSFLEWVLPKAGSRVAE